jgi:uncharacterized membrane protein YgcG
MRVHFPASLLLYCCILCSYQAVAQLPVARDFSDRILRFHSDIDVAKDGTIHVRENIRVYNGDGENSAGFERSNSYYTNNDIQRGIVRDFPTRYQDTSGFWVETGFDVISVTRNNKEENYDEENLTNGTRLKVGSADVILPPGVHDYVIEYRTHRQLIFHETKNELYWNVNGNGWVFTVDTISCIIRFPEGAKILESACYTGVQGSISTDCISSMSAPNEILFRSTKKAEAYEGLTVAAAISKGIIEEPGPGKRFFAFLQSNYIIPLLTVLLLMQVIYYSYVWYRKGRDPKKGIIFPQFSPPDGVTPADAGFILEKKYDSKLFAAALIDCAVKKKLKIEVSREGLLFKSNVYQFKQPDSPVNGSTSSDEYGFLLSSIYGLKAEKGKYNSALRSCYTSLHTALKDRYQVRSGKKNRKKGAFVLNKGYTVIGFVMVVAAAFLSFQFFTTHPSNLIGVLSASFVAVMLIIHLVFRSIMSAYTKEGRQLVDHLLGFRMYLAQAEKHVYNQLAPPERTLELFEKYLPYAIALEVENEWSSKFDDIVAKAIAEGYTPGYYSVSGGRMHHFTASELSRGISSGLSSTVSSASTPPSSSRGGSSGGGRSGGGGGGGGGGGW